MKIVLATFGSRGDVQPMLALSLALESKGHDVLLAAPLRKKAKEASQAIRKKNSLEITVREILIN